MVGSGGDDEDRLRRLHATFTGNQAHTIRLPAAALSFPRPFLIWADNTTIDGAGVGETICFTYGRYDAIVAGQLNPTTPDGRFTYNYASRPDITRVLDGTVQGYGFKTFGRSFAIDKGNGLQFGTYDRGVKCWDYWANTPGWTIEYAFSGKPAPGSTLFGCGIGLPYEVAVPDDHTLWHRFTMEGDPPGSVRISVVNGIDFNRPVNRIRESHDHVTGEVVVWVNGVNQVPAGREPGTFDIKGKSLKRNDRGSPFMIGPNDGIMPDYTLLGLKVSAVAVSNDAGNDRDRYLTQSPGCVGGFDSTDRGPEGHRALRMFGGPAAAEGYGYALVFDKISSGVGPARTTIQNLEVNSGIMLAGTTHTRIKNVKATGKGTGLSHCHNFANYPVDTDGLTLGGDVAALDEYNSMSTHSHMNIISGGIASIVTTGCKDTFNELFVGGFGGRQEWVMMALSGMYAGQITLDFVTVDGEWQVLSKGGFYVENCVGQARTFRLTGGAMGGIDPVEGHNIYLADAPAGSDAFAAHVKVEDCGLVAGLPAAFVGNDWYGTIDVSITGPVDLSQPRLVLPPVGPGASKVKWGPP
jgi:hypothetical protein